ncbi:hypothetical protein PV328_012337, partial [Microctonus aethiopoides]
MEWLMVNVSYNDTIMYLMNIADQYLNIHGTYEGLVVNIAGVQARLVINILERVIWFMRIRIEDDPRPPNVQYFPRIAPLHLEELWNFLPLNDINNHNNDNSHNDNSNNNNDNSNNNDNNNDDNNNDNNDTDEVSTHDDDDDDDDEDDDDGNNDGNNAEMQEFFLQNWIAADGDESGYLSYEEDDEDDD